MRETVVNVVIRATHDADAAALLDALCEPITGAVEALRREPRVLVVSMSVQSSTEPREVVYEV